MECNKEEAVRAKSIAMKKMENRDFLGARKIANKAKNLYPELENISQLIMVCDVHCSAENKVRGTEMDWYGILKIERTADDVLIKKQFRKLALSLHPDKNKFAGAADAFKLIGEAHRVLMDRETRRLHDMKCNYSAANGAQKQANGPSIVPRPSGPANSSVNANQQFHQAPQTAQTGFYSNLPTFWTACPYCFIRYQYYRHALNKALSCQTCGKTFTGYEVNAERVAPQNYQSHPAFTKQAGVTNEAPSKVGQQSSVQNSNAKVKAKGKSGFGNTSSSAMAQESKPNKKHEDVSMNRNQKKRKAEKTQPCVNMNGKKGKQFSESSESCKSETSSDSEEEISIEVDGFFSDQFPRRSSRSRTNVSYNETINDDDDPMEPAEGKKGSDTSEPTKEAVDDLPTKQEPPVMDKPTGLDGHLDKNDKKAKMSEHNFQEEVMQTKGNETKKKSENEKPSEDAETEPEIFEYPDPDFSDFDKDRQERCFAAGQIWAIYDTKDAMPRFYAQIKKVLNPKFKLRITWLEPDPDDEYEMKWVDEDLPVSCGKFRHGSSENSEDHPMFSHLVSWEKGGKRDTYKIYPRKGETWALFKNWDINWSSDLDNSRKYEYEFVEVLSDYTSGTAISVVYLWKVKGYVCLFCRAKPNGVDSFEISPKELFKFSHRVPSFQMTGKEREDIPKGSFELDPACLPSNLPEIDPPASEEVKIEKLHPHGSSSTFATDSVETIPKFHINESENKAEERKQSDSFVEISDDEENQILDSDQNGGTLDDIIEDNGLAPDRPEEAYEIPDPEFYNFDADKSIEKFETGQIWAMYSDEDGLPKYYGKIKKIDLLPVRKLHIVWLVAGSIPNNIIQWTDKKMPVACGKFKLKKMKSKEYTSTASFSHQVKVMDNKEKKGEYIILPSKGEVWALYKNWSSGMKCSDLEDCGYDMVEVVDEHPSGISVLSLEVVHGFKSVFRAQMKGQSPVQIKIPANELLRFSHRIPAFRLTEERGGSLRGHLELDPASLPFHWFCMN